MIVTSDKCYENDGRAAPLRENAPMGGHDPYSASKGCAELVTRAFARSSSVTRLTAVRRPRRQCDRRWRLGGGPHRSRPRARGESRDAGDRSAGRIRYGRGSTCSNRCRLSAARTRAATAGQAFVGRLEFRPARGRRRRRCDELVEQLRSRMAGRSTSNICEMKAVRTKRRCSGWTAPRRGTVSAGSRCSVWTARST